MVKSAIGGSGRQDIIDATGYVGDPEVQVEMVMPIDMQGPDVAQVMPIDVLAGMSGMGMMPGMPGMMPEMMPGMMPMMMPANPAMMLQPMGGPVSTTVEQVVRRTTTNTIITPMGTQTTVEEGVTSTTQHQG